MFSNHPKEHWNEQFDCCVGAVWLHAMSAEGVRTVPDFVEGKTPILGRFYGPEEQVLWECAAAATQAGLAAYPQLTESGEPHKPILVQNIYEADTNNPRNTFHFHGELAQTIPPAQVQHGVLRRLQTTTEPIAAVVAVASNETPDATPGYMGASTAVEFGYLMATGKPAVMTEHVSNFSPAVSPALQAIITEHQDQYQVLAPAEMTAATITEAAGVFVAPELTDQEKRRIMFEVIHLERSLRAQYPGTPQRYEAHGPSIQPGKVLGVQEGVRAYQRTHTPEMPTVAIELDVRKFPSGEGQPRPEQPIAVNNYTVIEEAADARIGQFDVALAEEGDGPKEGVIRLTVAQESGLHLDFADPQHIAIEDVTVSKIKNLDTGEVSTGISDPVPVLAEDVLAVEHTGGGVMQNTIGKVVQKRLRAQGVKVNHQDWYEQYDAPNNLVQGTKNQSRTFYIKQASARAAEQGTPQTSTT